MSVHVVRVRSEQSAATVQGAEWIARGMAAGCLVLSAFIP